MHINEELIGSKDLKVPTFNDLFNVYPELCEAQRKRTGGRPGQKTVENNLYSMKRLLETLEWNCDRPYTDLTTAVCDKLFEYLKTVDGLKAITAKSYLDGFRSVIAKWTVLRYAEYGYKVDEIRLPSLFVPPIRYKEISDEKKRSVIELIDNLKQIDPDSWFFATMMLQFGMRNSDVKRLTWDNFIFQEDSVFLEYTPHKTRLTSGRRVKWPVPDKVWNEILDYRLTRSEKPFKIDGSNVGRPGLNGLSAEKRLSKYMRSIGFSGSKSAYELRKLCGSLVYKNMGQEAVTSILGDDIKTVLKYYADPSSVSKKVDMTTLI
jgi:integrase